MQCLDRVLSIRVIYNETDGYLRRTLCNGKDVDTVITKLAENLACHTDRVAHPCANDGDDGYIRC